MFISQTLVSWSGLRVALLGGPLEGLDAREDELSGAGDHTSYDIRITYNNTYYATLLTPERTSRAERVIVSPVITIIVYIIVMFLIMCIIIIIIMNNIINTNSINHITNDISSSGIMNSIIVITTSLINRVTRDCAKVE